MCVVITKWRSLGEVAATIEQTMPCSDFVAEENSFASSSDYFVFRYTISLTLCSETKGLTGRYSCTIHHAFSFTDGSSFSPNVLTVSPA